MDQIDVPASVIVARIGTLASQAMAQVDEINAESDEPMSDVAQDQLYNDLIIADGKNTGQLCALWQIAFAEGMLEAAAGERNRLLLKVKQALEEENAGQEEGIQAPTEPT